MQRERERGRGHLRQQHSHQAAGFDEATQIGMIKKKIKKSSGKNVCANQASECMVISTSCLILPFLKPSKKYISFLGSPCEK